MPVAPVYAAAKAGVVHFTRSMAPTLSKRGIIVAAVCPEFVDTALVSEMGETVCRGSLIGLRRKCAQVRNVHAESPELSRRLLGQDIGEMSLLTPDRVGMAEEREFKRKDETAFISPPLTDSRGDAWTSVTRHSSW